VGGPEWVAIVVALIALIGSVITNVITWRSHSQLRRDHLAELDSSEARAGHDADDAERRDRRDRAVEIYQWAAELAVSPDSRQAQVGVDALKGLLDGNLLDEDTKLLVEGALASANAAPVKAIERALDDGVAIRVVEVELEALAATDVPLEAAEQVQPDADREAQDG
jgi:hypothetical protein